MSGSSIEDIEKFLADRKPPELTPDQKQVIKLINEQNLVGLKEFCREHRDFNLHYRDRNFYTPYFYASRLPFFELKQSTLYFMNAFLGCRDFIVTDIVSPLAASSRRRPGSSKKWIKIFVYTFFVISEMALFTWALALISLNVSSRLNRSVSLNRKIRLCR